VPSWPLFNQYGKKASTAAILALLATITPIFSDIGVAAANQLEGISITPPMNDFVLSPEQSAHRFTIIVTNHSEATINLEVSSIDFGALEDSGGLFFLGESADIKWDKHRLARWINIESPQLDLRAGEQKEIVATINNLPSLSPGGHYAAIVARLRSSNNTSTISLRQAVSSLLFVNKTGGEVFGISANLLDADVQWWGSVDRATVHLSNIGNTHVVPRGQFVVKDPFNRSISQGILNAGSTILLPESKQAFDATLTPTSAPLWPGKYSLVLSFRHDGHDDYQVVAKEVFLVGRFTLIFLGLLTVAGGIGLMLKMKKSRTT
jgi:hypothetical protein